MPRIPPRIAGHAPERGRAGGRAAGVRGAPGGVGLPVFPSAARCNLCGARARLGPCVTPRGAIKPPWAPTAPAAWPPPLTRGRRPHRAPATRGCGCAAGSKGLHPFCPDSPRPAPVPRQGPHAATVPCLAPPGPIRRTRRVPGAAGVAGGIPQPGRVRHRRGRRGRLRPAGAPAADQGHPVGAGGALPAVLGPPPPLPGYARQARGSGRAVVAGRARVLAQHGRMTGYAPAGRTRFACAAPGSGHGLLMSVIIM